MKNICTAALFLILGISLFKGQQQDLSKIKVNYSAGQIPATEAVERFITENKIKSFAYSTDQLEKYKIQGVKCTDESVLDCTSKILKGLPFEAIIYNNTIIIRQKIRKVSVSDTEESIPLMATQQRKDTIDLFNRETKIEEITLNAGYYSVKDKERTGSIAKVTAKEIENQPVNNVLSTVQGRMAGVSIIQNGGVPGGGYQVQIRGRNSLRTISNSGIDGSQPLYVVDGVPFGTEISSLYSSTAIPNGSINPLNSISPSDIESIEVLKDADATAIYGSRGANGVVLVTTKKGKSGVLRLSFNTTYSLSQSMSNLEMMDATQYLNMRKQAFANSGINVYPATAYDLNGTWDQSRDTDWAKTLIGNTATSSNSTLSLSGGSDTTTFLLSLAHNEQTTVFGKNFKYKTNNISNNITHRSKGDRLQLNISNMFSIQENNMINSDITRNSFLLAPNAPTLYNEDGSLNWENNTFDNPIAAYEATYSNKNIQFLNNLNAQFRVSKDIRLKLNTGINYQAFEEWSLRPHTTMNPSTGATAALSQAYKYNQNRFSFIVEPQVNWRYLKGNHELDVLVGGSFQNEVNSQGSMKGTGFESNVFIQNIAAAQTKTINDQIRTEYRYAAVFGRLNYQFEKRFILNITGRRDGSSRFGPNKKFANFAAIGGAWLFSKENFFEKAKWLSFGKLRGSYGTAGSDNIGDYQYLDTYTVSTFIYNGVTGLAPSRLYNPDYSWEKTTKLEAALELGLFKNRINLTTAWYQNRSSNQLVGYQLPAITGFTSVLANLDATVQNTGWELEISGHPFKSQRFQWETGINISFPRNKLLSFTGLEGSTYANSYVIGQPTSIIKLYQLEGINPQTGQYNFKDFNGDGKITADDRQTIENIGMDYFGGWYNNLKYKNWDVSFLFQFVKQRSRNYNYILPSPGLMTNLPVEALNVWSAQNPNGLYMPYKSTVNPSHSLFQNSDVSVSDASFIRLKNLQIEYRIPIRNSVFREVKVYFQGQNLITWTKYFGLDPEFASMGFLPPLRTYAFGAQFNL
ncbi:SusC/RagA family TonB-linked outer membrane protein [Chryseobacterium sp. ISL-6]|uniref:SusC/RagA family TonB-linked outer membrane protein n=1 Tax=Chryseobacterium sp. ISL-6 TaxID=2819143 RepID=UPI001BE65518|nr:SusC/RagA family TonB-linked outer membrane protein [Chryseobacterium sp. ISL-6]MBT2621917.1 SusC/RagA family TonB-linked outer membrane protein [Chryseobacterium sp. ISL-6]